MSWHAETLNKLLAGKFVACTELRDDLQLRTDFGFIADVHDNGSELVFNIPSYGLFTNMTPERIFINSNQRCVEVTFPPDVLTRKRVFTVINALDGTMDRHARYHTEQEYKDWVQAEEDQYEHGGARV